MTTSVVIALTVVSLSLWAPEAKAEKLAVHVSAPLSGGFFDATSGISDSIKDVSKRIAGMSEFRIVSDFLQADIILVVEARGVGSAELGRAGWVDATDTGISGGYRKVYSNDFWVLGTMLLRADHAFKKRLVGSYSNNSGNALANIGAWTECAKRLAKDVQAFGKANAARLIAGRPRAAADAKQMLTPSPAQPNDQAGPSAGAPVVVPTVPPVHSPSPAPGAPERPVSSESASAQTKAGGSKTVPIVLAAAAAGAAVAVAVSSGGGSPDRPVSPTQPTPTPDPRRTDTFAFALPGGDATVRLGSFRAGSGQVDARLTVPSGRTLCMCIGVENGCFPFCGGAPSFAGAITVSQQDPTLQPGRIYAVQIYCHPREDTRSAASGTVTVTYPLP